MGLDDQMRWLLIAGWLPVIFLGLRFRLRARTAERLDRRQEGLPILLTLRPLASLHIVLVVAFMVDPSALIVGKVEAPAWMRWSGALFAVAGAATILWTFRFLGRNLTDTVVTRADATLVTGGPYRWVRHPFYLAFALIVTANSLCTANALVAVTGYAAFAAIAARTRTEERFLVEKFGAEYTEYAARTPRFVPRLARSRNP
ncbi:MAG: isoprenylcysteine carboxylmethyltransferase family protein [Myxococcota bacterium]